MAMKPLKLAQNAQPLESRAVDQRKKNVSDSNFFGMNGPVKRGIDILFSSAVLIFLAPLLFVVALLIKRDGGPAIYTQNRIGRDGELFRIFKFRTMRVDADATLKALLETDAEVKAEWDEFQKLKDDPRITPIGHFLRTSSIDELPQFLNVLIGDMSVVGHRPLLVQQRSAYGSHISEYERARPGITGLWQVSGRNEVNFETRIFMDCQYINRWSLMTDAKIIAQTVPAILFKKDAF